MSKKETAKRYILFIISLFFSGLGIAFTKRGELGVSPISSVANIMSYKFTSLSMGTWLIIWSMLMIAAQIVILRKKFAPIQLLQIPLAFVFGYFTDFGLWIVSFIPVNNYIMQLVMVFAGVIVLGFGVSLAFVANVIMNSGEALVKVIADTLHKDFGNVKIVFDVSCVTFSIILSLLFFDFTLVGTREGTLVAAFGTGIAVKWFNKRIYKPIDAVLKK